MITSGTRLIGENGSCVSEGNYAIGGDCIRFYKCIRSYGGKLLGLLMKCPSGFQFIESRCVRINSAVNCPQEKLGRDELNSGLLGFNSGFPVPIHWYPQLVQL